MASTGHQYCDSCSACEQERSCARDQDDIASNAWAYESQCSWWTRYSDTVLAQERAHEQKMGY